LRIILQECGFYLEGAWLWRISGGHRRRCCEWFI